MDNSKNQSGKPTPTAQQLAGMGFVAGLKTLEANFPMQLELIDFKARIVKARFDAAVSHGFTHVEALELCTKDWSL